MTKMQGAVLTLASLVVVVPARAQVFKLTPEQLIKYTAGNPFGRFPDGRPKVPDSILERVKDMSMEEVFGVEELGFPSQYADGWRILHPEKKLVGRAVTLLLMPLRPEVADVDSTGRTTFWPDRPNIITHQKALDLLQPGDVVVVDAHNVVGGVVGDNLATYVNDVGAGFVIDGMIRDLEGIREIGMTGYYRQAAPPSLTNCMSAGINIPVSIGNVTVLPGDVVLGDSEGVYFIPPSVVEKLVDEADTTHLQDAWYKMKFGQGVGQHGYKSTDIYDPPHDPALLKEFEEYQKVHIEEIRNKRK